MKVQRKKEEKKSLNYLDNTREAFNQPLLVSNMVRKNSRSFQWDEEMVLILVRSRSDPVQSLKLQSGRGVRGSKLLSQRHSDFLWFVCPVATGVLQSAETGRTRAAPSPSTPPLTGHITRRCHSHVRSLRTWPTSPSPTTITTIIIILLPCLGQSALTPCNLSHAAI